MSLTLLLSFAAGCGAFLGTATPVPATATLNSGAANADNPTAAALRLATRQAQATLNSQATSTWQAALAAQTAMAADRATGTAEAQAAQTATVVARATYQAVVAAKSAWPRRTLETFADNQLGWPVGVMQDNSLAVTPTIAGGRYQLLVNVVKEYSYFKLIPDKGPVQTDFYALVNVKFVSGNDASSVAYGLVVRRTDDAWASFSITNNGLFQIIEFHNPIFHKTALNSSPAIDLRPGATNRIAVVGVGRDFVFLINDKVVGGLAADLAAGQIGLWVHGLTPASAAQVDFSDFEVYAP